MAKRAGKATAGARRSKGSKPGKPKKPAKPKKLAKPKKSRQPKKPRPPKKHRGPLIIDRAAPAALLEAKRKTRESLDARERDLTFVTLLGRESNWVRRALPA